jgi:hypothetical protein
MALDRLLGTLQEDLRQERVGIQIVGRHKLCIRMGGGKLAGQSIDPLL